MRFRLTSYMLPLFLLFLCGCNSKEDLLPHTQADVMPVIGAWFLREADFESEGYKTFKRGDFEIMLETRMDMALWINEDGKWQGIIQGWEGDVPDALLAITKNWLRLGLPVPWSETE